MVYNKYYSTKKYESINLFEQLFTTQFPKDPFWAIAIIPKCLLF